MFVVWVLWRFYKLPQEFEIAIRVCCSLATRVLWRFFKLPQEFYSDSSSCHITFMTVFQVATRARNCIKRPFRVQPQEFYGDPEFLFWPLGLSSPERISTLLGKNAPNFCRRSQSFLCGDRHQAAEVASRWPSEGTARYFGRCGNRLAKWQERAKYSRDCIWKPTEEQFNILFLSFCALTGFTQLL